MALCLIKSSARGQNFQLNGTVHTSRDALLMCFISLSVHVCCMKLVTFAMVRCPLCFLSEDQCKKESAEELMAV